MPKDGSKQKTMNAHYIAEYYKRHPEKRLERRLKDAIRLLMKNGYSVVPPIENNKNVE